MIMTKSKDELESEKEETSKTLETDIARVNKEESEKKRQDSLEEARFQHQRQWAKVMDELRQSHFLPKNQRREGGPQTHWDEVKQLADDIINSKQTSINDWRSNMMDLLNMFAKLNKAINISSNQVSGEALNLIKGATHEVPIVRSITHPKEFIYEGVKSAILHRIKGDNDIKVDTFEQKVTFNKENGKVEVALLKRKDGIPFNASMANKAFEKLVDLWLQENDYVMDSQTKIYKHHPDGEPLTEQKFNQLKKGLGKFLEETASFKFEEQEDLRSGLPHN